MMVLLYVDIISISIYNTSYIYIEEIALYWLANRNTKKICPDHFQCIYTG